MKKNEAIKWLKDLKLQLVNGNLSEELWILSAKSYFEKIYGIGNKQYLTLCKMYIKPKSRGVSIWPDEQPSVSDIERQNKAIAYLDLCMDLIGKIGLINQYPLLRILKDNKKKLLIIILFIFIIGAVSQLFFPFFLSGVWDFFLRLISKV